MFSLFLKPHIHLHKLPFRAITKAFSLEKDIPASYESLSEKLLSNTPEPPSEIDPSQPKWMRFFQSSNQIKIDLNRSIKTENLDLITNYIRISYVSFDFGQLVLSLEKNFRQDINSKLLEEIKLRIVLDTAEFSSENLLSLLNFSLSMCLKDVILSRFLTIEFIKVFFTFKTLNEKTQVIQFLLLVNRLPSEILEEFYKELEPFQTAVNEDLWSEFSLKSVNLLVGVVDILYRVLDKGEFQRRFNGFFLERLYEELIENLDGLIEGDEGLTQPPYLNNVLQIACPNFFTFQQKTQYKEIACRILTEKLKEEANFGRYNINKKDKNLINTYILRIFTPSDRLLIQDLLQSLGQQSLKDIILRKDPLLFTGFSALNTVSRFFFHEQLSFLSFRKLLEIQNLFLLRSYLQINYDALVKSPAANEYLKSSWNHLISNLSDVIIGIFNKKIDSFFKSLKDLFMASQKKSEYISMRDAENETENLGFDKIQDEKEDSFQILDKAQVKIKELNGLIEKIPLVRSFQFQFKNNEVLGLKSLLIIIDLAKSMISLRLGGLDDSKSEMIAEVLRNLLQKPDFEMVFTYFPLIPSLLENLLILNNKMTKNPLLTKKMTDETLRIKGLIDDLLNNVQNGDMVETIRALKKQAGERKIEMELNWNESLFFTMINSKFYLSDEIEGKFREEDFFKETYVVNNRNIAKKILNSKMFFYLMNESILKTVIWKVLSREKDLNAKRNIIDFPFYCDFTCEYNEKKFVLMIKDHHKMVLGVENIMVPYFIELKDFWQQKGFIVKWISYEDYVIESHRQIFHLKHILMQD